MVLWWQMLVTIACSVLASSGFWAFIQSRDCKKGNQIQLLLGLAHDKIVGLGVEYMDRGDWITQDEYENLHDYLYVPYEACGGNGTAKKIMDEVNSRLRIVPTKYKESEGKA